MTPFGRDGSDLVETSSNATIWMAISTGCHLKLSKTYCAVTGSIEEPIYRQMNWTSEKSSNFPFKRHRREGFKSRQQWRCFASKMTLLTKPLFLLFGIFLIITISSKAAIVGPYDDAPCDTTTSQSSASVAATPIQVGGPGPNGRWLPRLLKRHRLEAWSRGAFIWTMTGSRTLV